MKNKFRPLVAAALVFVMAVMGFFAGAIVTTSSVAQGKDRYSDLQMFTKVLNLVEQHYVEEVDTKKLIYGAIKGMLASLDPHTNFLPPDVFKEFKQETSGEFGGLGIEISVQDDVLTVMSPIEDTPAFKAGIKAGDKIVEVEGKSTKGITLAEAVNKMRGKRGSPITIGVWREGWEAPKKFTLVRDVIHVHSIKYTDMQDGYAYIRITSFIERTGDDLKKAIEKHEKAHGKLKGLILDLRNNAGGLLDQAIDVCNQFINDGVIVSTMGRNTPKEVVYAKKEGRTDFPIVVLMNEYSASASEIVGGALQDHKRAVIMGNRSFGKGSVQSVVELGDGAGLKLTVARYYTPSGRSIQAQGIEPDIHLDPVDTEAFEKAIIHKKVMREGDIEGHLINEADKAKLNAAAEDNKDDKDKNVVETEFFWKKEKVKDAEAEAKRKEEEEAKLPPYERLIRKDFQVAQALNYIKAYGVFQKMDLPGAGAASEPAKSSDAKAPSDLEKDMKKAGQPQDNGAGEGAIKVEPKAKAPKKVKQPKQAAKKPAAGADSGAPSASPSEKPAKTLPAKKKASGASAPADTKPAGE